MLDEFTGPCAVAAYLQLSIKGSFSHIHKKRMFIVCIQVSACIEHDEQGMEEEEKGGGGGGGEGGRGRRRGKTGSSAAAETSRIH